MLSQTVQPIWQAPWALNASLSIVLIVLLAVLRWALARQIRSAGIRHAELRRRWLVTLRNIFLAVLAIGLVLIWGEYLRNLALSLVAIIVAVVLAIKELILCVTGGLLKTASRSFALGDRIEVAGVRGDVIDQTVLTTTILETGPGEITHQHTGRAVVLPNSLFLNSPVINESFTDDFVLHVFRVPVAASADWQREEAKLLAAAETACGSYLDEARRHFARIASREQLDIPPIDPRVILSIPTPGQIDLIVRVPVPARRRGRIEQEILRGYLSADGAVPPEGPARTP